MGSFYEAVIHVTVFGALFAIVGAVLCWTMQSEKQIFGFIPPWIEKHYGIESKIYHLATCPNCLAGQAALWGGLPYLFIFGIAQYISQIFVAVFLSFITVKIVQ